MTIFGYTCKIAVLVMTEIVLAHHQKYVPVHYFLVRPNASPKRTLNLARSHARSHCLFYQTGVGTNDKKKSGCERWA